MARKTNLVTIQAARDAGKVFLITEMPATQAEKWGIRAAAVIAASGFDMPAEAGFEAVVAAGFQAFLRGEWSAVEPLLDEMMTCVQAMPDPAKPGIVRALVETDTEEPTTLIKLRDEVFALHAGFSIAGALSTLGQSASPAENFESTPTSDASSAELSPAA